MFVKGGAPSTLGVRWVTVSKMTGQGPTSLFKQKLTGLSTGSRASNKGLKSILK